MQRRQMLLTVALSVTLAAAVPAVAEPLMGGGGGPEATQANASGGLVSGSASRGISAVNLTDNQGHEILKVKVTTTAPSTRLMASATTTLHGATDNAAAECWLNDGGGATDSANDASERMRSDIPRIQSATASLAVNGAVVVGKGAHTIRLYCSNLGSHLGAIVLANRSNLVVWGMPKELTLDPRAFVPERPSIRRQR